jgi:DNA-nicking Smr family endonuclease
MTRQRLKHSRTIDLHGLTVKEAMAYTIQFLKKCSWSQGEKVEIITGAGRHSEKRRQKIQPALTAHLMQHGYRISVQNEGCLIVSK